MTFHPARATRRAAIAFAAGVAALYALTFAAVAASDTEVVFSVGDQVAWMLPTIATVGLVLAFAAWRVVKALLPGWLGSAIDPFVDRLLPEAIDYAANAVDGAAKGKTVTVDVGNRMLAEALRYFEAQGDRAAKAIGRRQRIARRIISYLDLEPGAVVEDDPDGNPKIKRREQAGRR